MMEPTIARRDILIAAGGLIGAAMVATEARESQAKEIDVSKVPAVVTEAANRTLKGVKWTAAHRNKESFELEGKDGKDHSVSIDVTTDGKVQGVDRKIDVKEVPKPVLKTVTAKFPKLEIDRAHEVFSGTDIKDLSKAELTYELDGKGQKGHEVTVTLTAKGDLIDVKREVELKAVPRVVTDALGKKYPKFKPAVAHSVSEGEGVTGYLFVGDFRKEMTETMVFVSADGKEVEMHHDE